MRKARSRYNKSVLDTSSYAKAARLDRHEKTDLQSEIHKVVDKVIAPILQRLDQALEKFAAAQLQTLSNVADIAQRVEALATPRPQQPSAVILEKLVNKVDSLNKQSALQQAAIDNLKSLQNKVFANSSTAVKIPPHSAKSVPSLRKERDETHLTTTDNKKAKLNNSQHSSSRNVSHDDQSVMNLPTRNFPTNLPA
ncbi:hypothetical protein JTE90_002927 [Oedothorax gibbosus]|uniref:Uncharacterized protein n=1 Tax=Oedothorax gibbosus TaxID=931172 RepID=A0AAV6UU16_9ARAC|nr:hypothetical protein JTE90_002927 [Oedothorax gibbosus]